MFKTSKFIIKLKNPMKSTQKNLANTLKFNGILLIQTTITEMQNNLAFFALSSTEESLTFSKEEVINFSISCQILKLGQNILSIVSTGNYIYEFLTDSEKSTFQKKRILNLKKKFQKYKTNKVKFHILLEGEDLESKEQNLELEPTHLFYDIDFYHYFDEFFKNNRHIRFQSQKFQKDKQASESEIIKNISFVLFDIKKMKEREVFLENYLENVPQIFSELIPMQGQTIYTIGSPYGVLSSELYKNMLHKGIISNVFKIKNVDNMRQKILQKYLFSLDLLVISGNEGGAILDDKFNFFGMLLPPLLLANSDAKYFSFGVNYNFILQLIVDSNNRMISMDHFPETNEIMGEKMVYIKSYLNRFESIIPNPLETSLKQSLFGSMFNICLIIYKGSWASGIMIDRKKGIILTVSHIIEGEIEKDCNATVKFTNYNELFKAKLIKKSKGSYDVGLLQIDDSSYFNQSRLLIPRKIEVAKSISAGKTIYAIGYGIFSPSSFNNPMISRGIISKIIYDPQNIPKLIQTDCKIFNGYSGGGLFTENGYFVGMIVYNVKEVIGGIKENINFSYHYKMFEEFFESLNQNIDGMKIIDNNELWIKKDDFIDKAGDLQTRQNVPIYKLGPKL